MSRLRHSLVKLCLIATLRLAHSQVCARSSSPGHSLLLRNMRMTISLHLRTDGWKRE